ncbi:ABC transporter permease [Duganella sp. BJB488]|uniref:ABC transporter permease n=1 Tax=unclassified Duganella TaxID=2636909 RepID=UPI000E35589C|nr:MULTISPECIES: ABC transporter permease [unclassified Duganella]NVD71302.1 ABC transporter permease [Duganella sp. BJB1802]RFP20468.1 ABC transporter permease [Duganella sp. BJB489]RFP21093.1 ABC transporter permease [Duganella sp. BJB488]RFP33232.1 ABC transporter permease [Duganella sp. BJB480]
MYTLRLIFKNAMRHKLRTSLTILGLVVAIFSFGLLQTVVDAWYAGAEGASNTTLVTRNKTSLVFPLPLSYQARIRAVPGVSGVGFANWFQGTYKDPKNFFAQFAISGESYLDIYPDYLLPPEQRADFLKDRKGCIVGRKLADQYGFKVGDIIPLKGTIYPGNWELVVRGIYDGRQSTTNTATLFFHWDYVNETMKKVAPRRANQIGVFVVQIDQPENAAGISAAVDKEFANSLAETLTETEKAFQLGFVSMSEAIVVAIRVVSFVVIVIIGAVMANTMAMSARERLGEYATLKALGFGPGFLALMIFGESLLLAAFGAAIGIVILFPFATVLGKVMGTMFPVFEVSRLTVLQQVLAALVIGTVAAIAPTIRAVRINIVDGLRSIG